MALMQAIDTAPDRIRQHPTFLQIDLSGCGMAEVLALCAEFAGLCATAGMRGAMVKGGDEEVRRCMVVRDLIRIVLLVAPRDFRLALVPGTPRTAAVYRKSEAELRAAGLDARFFESEALAARWFGA